MIQDAVIGKRPDARADELWAVLDELPVRVSYIDREWRHRYANREYAMLIGLPISEILGKTVADIYGEEEETRLKPFGEAALRGETVRWEGWVKLPGGVDRYVRRIYKPHRNDGEVDGYFVLVRDITEYQRAENEQRRLSQLLHDAVESIPNGIAVYDASEQLVACNTAFASFLDDEPRSMIGTTVTAICDRAGPLLQTFGSKPITDSDSLLGQFTRVLREADGTPVEIQLKDGQWTQISCHPTADGGRVVIRTDITRLKQAEASLRDSEQRFRSIVERNPLPICVNELESGRILYESPAAAALVGRTWPTPKPGWTTEYYVDIANRADYLEKLREQGEIDGYELRLRKADGTEFWASVTARIFIHEGQELVVTSIVDLTERKQREAELRQARETLEDAIESLSEGFALWDAEDRLVTCNQRYREFNSLSADVLVPGVKWEHYMRTGAERGQYVAAVGRVDEWLDEFKAHRAGLVTNLEFQQADNRWFQASLQRTRQGGIVVIRRDITERKEMEKALRESEARFRTITVAHPIPLAIVRLNDGKMLYVSQPFADLFQLSVEEALGRHAQDYYKNPADRTRFIEAIRRDGAVTGFEIEATKVDGSTFWTAITSKRIEFEGEDAVVTAFYDLTERRAAEQELAHQREALYQSEKLNALGVLLAGVAHELNNPLSVVVGQALLFRDAAADPKTRQRAERIANAADRCSRIVKTFLAMARQTAPARREVNLNDIIESALEITAYTLRSADVEVTRRLSPELPAVWADPDQLTQVVMNLIVNAEQAMADKIGKRKLEIITDTDDRGELVQLSVRDNGPGIPEENRPRVFEPFFTTKEVGIGTGVGLSVSRGIIQAHEGTIDVQSKPRAGTTFKISLPRSQKRHVEAEEPVVAERSSGQGRVLIVDDEPDVSEMLADILSLDDHEIEVANSGNVALRILAHREFDVILSDIRMPDVDGRGLYTRIKNAYPHLIDRIIFITGDALGPSIRAFLDQTGLPCLEKPVSPDEVRRLVEQVLAGRARATSRRRIAMDPQSSDRSPR